MAIGDKLAGSMSKRNSGTKQTVSKLFKNSKGAGNPSLLGVAPPKSLISSSFDKISREIESPSYVDSFLEDRSRFRPNVDFSDPSNFARFGSAEEYYRLCIENIYKTYPYDGSKKEKLDWHNSSSYFDNYFFEYEYPRTNGFISIGQTYTAAGTAADDGVDKIIEPSSPQYISIKGGPHGPQAPAYDAYFSGQLDYTDSDFKANIYNPTSSQIQNLTIDAPNGNTVEFWMKLPLEPSKSQTSPSHAYFDLWNRSTEKTTTGRYGRFLVETRLNKILNGSYIQDSIFHLTYMSGTHGVERAKIGPTTLSGAYGINLADWNHYAFVAKNNPTGSDHLELKLYINGSLIDTVHTGSQFSAVTEGIFNANIGAYQYNPASNLTVTDGEGSLSGSSFDEFRFWKFARSEKEISRNWFTQVAGGSNTDYGSEYSKFSGSSFPVDLGVYYKFNEGITGFPLQDKTILDYSGRVSNGLYNNYPALSAEAVRFTDSAIVSASAAPKEFKDPIIYNNHPRVVSLTNEKIAQGLEYDTRNTMAIYSMMPQWILDEDSQKNKFDTKKLTQIVASYFDETYMQIQAINKIKDVTYISGSVSGSSYKPLPFANRLLESKGFIAPELFSTTDVLPMLANRDDVREFKTELVDVKNQIYTNIYNNLDFINKSKGTEKSLRNLIRCFGVDDDIYALSFYANNSEITLNQSITPKIITKKFANFSTSSNFNALVYQSTASSNTNSAMYLTGSSKAGDFDAELGFTVEASVMFPAKLDIENPRIAERYYNGISSSLFGMHAATPVPQNEGDTSWADDDYGNFQVYAVREQNANLAVGSKYTANQIKFVLTGTNVNSTTQACIPFLTSSTFNDVYDDEKWHFAVKVIPSAVGIVSGTSGYTVEFHGYNTQADIVADSFVVTGSVSSGDLFLASKKRLYVGAHRLNYTGSLLCGADTKISNCRYWALPLEKDEIISHAIDISNYGLFDPMESAYLFQNYKVNVPKIRTLALNWDFDTVTGSNANGEFIVQDFSSGSGDSVFRKDLSDLLLKQHTGRGLFFAPSNENAVSKQHVFSYKQQVPENLDISDTIKILNKDQEFFTPRTRPTTFSFALEKSMYQAISEKMLNFLACSAEASGLENLVGEPVNKYRSEYKALNKIREIFYERIGNTPDLDKYLEYFQWLDTSIGLMVSQMVPASSEVDSLSNIVESHVFERSKVQHRFPTFEMGVDDPSGSIKAVGELLYNWEYGHAPTPPTAVPIPAKARLTFATGTNNSHYVNGLITLISTSGVSKTYKFVIGGGVTTGQVVSDKVQVQIDTFTTPGAVMAELLQAINHANGHNGGSANSVLSMSISGGGALSGDGIMVITQAVAGAAGNTAISTSLLASAVLGRPTAFAGGLDANQNENCLWWNQKASRQEAGLSTGNAGVDASRGEIHSASVQTLNRKFGSPYRLTVTEGNGALKTKYNKRLIVMGATQPFDNTKTLTYNTTTFTTSSKDCNDDLRIDPNQKRQAYYQVTINDPTNVLSVYKNNLVAPYTFFSSSVTATPTGVPIGFQAGPDHLRDYYLDTKEVPAQGPFTRQHVGGNQYRNLGFAYKPVQLNNMAAGDPRKDVIPQGYYALPSFAGGNFFYTIINPSYFGSTFTRADFTRDLIAKRPVNIKNIKTNTTSFSSSYGSLLSMGNYAHNYEIVQIADRSTNNRYFVENNGISTASAPSPALFGLRDYEVPDRGKHASIMVNRFSAPGGPEVSSPGYLDYESETFSVYNALPFRNLTVRQPLRGWLTKHSAFGGYDSEYGSPSASYHKVQRNGTKRIEYTIDKVYDIGDPVTTSSVYDNYWVRHMIPQSDLQYSWITASAISFPFGYAQPDPFNAGEASTDIGFALESDHGSYIFNSDKERYYGINKYSSGVGSGLDGTNRYGFVPVDFVGLNTHFVDTFSAFTNTISDTSLNRTVVNGGYAGLNHAGGRIGSPSKLNAINLRRNGPGGFSSWKQLRQAENPIVRYHNKNNFVSLMTQSVIAYPKDGTGIIKERTTVTFREPVVTSCYKPLKHHFVLRTGDEIDVKHTYANNLHSFNSKRINQLIDFETNRSNETYEDLKKIYLDNELGDFSPIDQFRSMNYREVIFPSKKHATLARTRGRENYTVSSGSDNFNLRLGDSVAFWKDNINDRIRAEGVAKNAQNTTIFSASAPIGMIDLSIWPLDAEEPFFNWYLVSGSAVGGTDAGFDPYFWSPLGPSGAFMRPDLEPKWNDVMKNGELSYAGWLFTLYDLNFDGKFRKGGSTDRGPITNSRAYQGGDSGCRVTASFQYEYPNLIWSGSFPYGNATQTRFVAGFSSGSAKGYEYITLQSSASLHLIPPYRADVLSGRTPWYNSYEDFAQDIRLIGKDYSIIPEFKISDHIAYYLDNGSSAENNKFLDLIGSTLSTTSSATTELAPFNKQFVRLYSNSDFMSKFAEIKQDHKKGSTAIPSRITLKVNAIKKLLPYNGFYPALRAVQLGHLFSASYAPFLSGSRTYTDAEAPMERLAALYQPFFAPGIFFNTIKSGIAVDYSVHTGSVPGTLNMTKEVSTAAGLPGINYQKFLGVDSPFSASNICLNLIAEEPNYAFPFEAILNPNRYLPLTASQDSLSDADIAFGTGYSSGSVHFVYPHFSGSLLGTPQVAGFAEPWFASSTTATDGRTKADIFFTWSGQSDIKYSLAANNFFAEVSEFFLERKSPTSFVSKQEKDFKPMTSGSVYVMDVVLSKTDDFVSYEGPSGSFDYHPYSGSNAPTILYLQGFGSGRGPGQVLPGTNRGNPKVSARGMHYGPPYLAQFRVLGTLDNESAYFEDPCFAIHTPPYFYGDAVARIEFRPHEARDMKPAEGETLPESAKFTLQEILANSKLSTKYFNTNTRAKAWTTGNSANLFYSAYPAGRKQMHISSSVDLFGSLTLKQINYNSNKDSEGNFVADGINTTVLQDSQDAWVIESKFECPSINLHDMDVASLGAASGLGREALYTRGIWKGYGQPPTGAAGIFLQIRESAVQKQSSTFLNPDAPVFLTGSLIDVCGFEASRERIGEIASSREISEAVVAIPMNSNGEFYNIDTAMFLQQLINVDNGDPAIKQGQFDAPSDIAETSISHMIKMMKKYIVPPQFDPLKNPSAAPVVMYIFEFTHTLSKTDLSYIWQNLMPDIAMKAEKDSCTIQHDVRSKYEFFGSTGYANSPFKSSSSDIKWMVFKIKKRGKNNFYNVTKKSEKALGFPFTTDAELSRFSSVPNRELNYSYNWPYDFFSLVELAQLEAGVDITPKPIDPAIAQLAGTIGGTTQAATGIPFMGLGTPGPPPARITDGSETTSTIPQSRSTTGGGRSTTGGFSATSTNFTLFDLNLPF